MKNRTKKSQSALEYLSAHIWAILLIAVIFFTLFQLGVFSSFLLGPRAQPGSCWIQRSSSGIVLEGVCGNLPPEFVMNAHGLGAYVAAQNSNALASPLNIQGNTITITAWADVFGSPFHDVVDKEYQYGMKLDYNAQPHACSGQSNQNGWCLEWDTAQPGGDWVGDGFPISTSLNNTFVFLAVTQQGGTKYWYANGKLLGSMSSPPANNIVYISSNLLIGSISPGEDAGYGTAEWFNGLIANVQVYNTTLSSSEITQLYLEGIGGTPINPRNLVGWWPLNGNGNDYSGNNANDALQTISYTSSWMNDYPSPVP